MCSALGDVGLSLWTQSRRPCTRRSCAATARPEHHQTPSGFLASADSRGRANDTSRPRVTSRRRRPRSVLERRDRTRLPVLDQTTRHRVTIGRDVRAYAMCAIDALGISAMLDQDVLIESHDVTNKSPITVRVLAGQAPGHSEWYLPQSVVFVGAEAGEGPQGRLLLRSPQLLHQRGLSHCLDVQPPLVPGERLHRQTPRSSVCSSSSHSCTTRRDRRPGAEGQPIIKNLRHMVGGVAKSRPIVAVTAWTPSAGTTDSARRSSNPGSS